MFEDFRVDHLRCYRYKSIQKFVVNSALSCFQDHSISSILRFCRNKLTTGMTRFARQAVRCEFGHKNCRNKAFDGKRYCTKHNCQFEPPCEFPIKLGPRFISTYCVDHTCREEYCALPIAREGMFCLEHTPCPWGDCQNVIYRLGDGSHAYVCHNHLR
jgi:hypothetical protein